MANFNSNLNSLVGKEVILTTCLNDQIHGSIAEVGDDCLTLQMSDQKKHINLSHVVSVIPKESITN